MSDLGDGGMLKSMKTMFIVMFISLLIAGAWNAVPVIKESVHAVLNPSVGVLLNWNVTWGMMLLVFIIALITILAQKYLTDQELLRELKAEQKAINEKAKEFKHDPEKMMEIQKEVLPLTGKIMELTMKASIYTIIPLILFFRWFHDYFTAAGDPTLLGFFNWFWFYLVFVMIFSSILRKWMKVA
jgi:uncharacterized membrane protein (DUF106 family)